MRTIALVGHGTYFDCHALLKTYDVIIALDGGYNFCKKNNVKPSVILGDGDSIEQPPTNFIELSDQTTTDLQKGLQYIKQHFQDYQIDLFGCTSHDRLDHTLTAINLLANNHTIRSLYTPYQHLQIIHQQHKLQQVSDFSLLSLTATAQVEIIGAKWSGQFTLADRYSGLSNQAIQDTIQITVSTGTVLCINSIKWN